MFACNGAVEMSMLRSVGMRSIECYLVKSVIERSWSRGDEDHLADIFLPVQTRRETDRALHLTKVAADI